MKITTPDNLNLQQRLAYRRAYSEAPAHLSHAEKHLTGLDGVMAHDLAVPGLDGFVIKLSADNTKNWDASGRNREFARGLDKGVTLATNFQKGIVKNLGNGFVSREDAYAYTQVPELKK